MEAVTTVAAFFNVWVMREMVMASEFVSYLSEVFAEFGTIRAKRMFGGYGVYHNDLMFGLVADDLLYLKADSTTLPDFEALGLQAFSVTHNGKVMQMSYHQAPEEIFEDFELAAVWARKAYDAAVRAQTAKAEKAARPKKTRSTTTKPT
jgi:DNA transformation protein